MWVSAQSNIRVASSAGRSYSEAFLVCFRGGAFSAILALVMCITGVTLVYSFGYVFFVLPGTITASEVPLLMVGYGFGASFVALFMQLGGGIYTKAADVGADLVGKPNSSRLSRTCCCCCCCAPAALETFDELCARAFVRVDKQISKTHCRLQLRASQQRR